MSIEESASEQLEPSITWVKLFLPTKTVIFEGMSHMQLIFSAEKEEMQTLKNSEQSF